MLKNRSVTYVLGLLLPMSLIYTPRHDMENIRQRFDGWRGRHPEQVWDTDYNKKSETIQIAVDYMPN